MGSEHQDRSLRASELLLLNRRETQRSSVDGNQTLHLPFKFIAVVDPAQKAAGKRVETAGSNV